jgi:hypothetical protein
MPRQMGRIVEMRCLEAPWCSCGYEAPMRLRTVAGPSLADYSSRRPDVC